MNNTPEVSVDPQPQPPVQAWRRPRFASRFSAIAQMVFATAVWWQNVPRASILNEPGNRYQPRPLGDKFKKSAPAKAELADRFRDRRGRGYARLTNGVIVRTHDDLPQTA